LSIPLVANQASAPHWFENQGRFSVQPHIAWSESHTIFDSDSCSMENEKTLNTCQVYSAI